MEVSCLTNSNEYATLHDPTCGTLSPCLTSAATGQFRCLWRLSDSPDRFVPGLSESVAKRVGADDSVPFMDPENRTLEVLKQIRDDGKRNGERTDETNARLNETNARINETNVRLESLRDDLGRRIVESELRTATAITELLRLRPRADHRHQGRS